nr:MAG TPA: hypothetical protein [Crassvirales sp.]
MAIIRRLKEVKNSKLHDAILLTTLVDNNKYTFIKVYVDSNKECAIYFKGLLSYRDIQAFFFNLRDDITSSSKIEDEKIKALREFEYDYDNNTTAIYTRDGWKY